MTHIEKLKLLSGTTFWHYFLQFKAELELHLDNDSTYVTSLFESEHEKEWGCDSATASDSIGCSDGVCDLLTALNINFEIV